MKKRLLALVLCLVMMLPTVLLTGCAKENSVEDDMESPRPTKSYVMYVIAEEGMDEEQADAVEAAINKILKSKYKTRLDIRYVPEDEYYTKLEAEIKAMREAQAASDEEETEPVEGDEVVTEEETVINENGFLEYKYPAFEEHQVDIFFLGGFDKYKEYIENGWLCAIDSELEIGSNKKLDDYINYQVLSAMTIVDGQKYAVPNNRVMGEYTYLLLRKDLMDKYYYGVSDINSITDAKEFLEDVQAYEKDYDPIAYDSYRDPTLVHYWSIDPTTLKYDSSKFSIIGNVFSNDCTYNFVKGKEGKIQGETSRQIAFASLFTKSDYRAQMLALKYYDCYNFYAEENSQKNFALSVVKGDAALADEYSDEYYVKIIDYPRATTEDIFGSMFAVCEWGGEARDDINRVMEIITYLNTNSDFRNLLQYGIENVNYTLNADGTIKRTAKNKYFMDINKTGNVFVAYPEEGMSADAWEYGKKQIKDMKIDCLLGFDFAAEVDDISMVNVKAIKAMLDESEKVAKELEAITSYEEYKAKLEEYTTRYATSKSDIRKYINVNAAVEGEPSYPVALYKSWLEIKGLIVDNS